MKNWRVFLTIVLLLFPLAPVTAANVPAQQDALRQEEREDYYKRWLDRDVIYIITPDEKSVFSSLTTPEEKEQFIEQFWRRRDPDPRTGHNEYKEEHYRRIAYANDHFHSGVEGWYTDRGKIYIKFGPPTSIEKNPTGTVYERRITEGGGTTMTYPFEVWYYQYLEGVGNGIEIEFVDSTNTGRYEMAMRPDEKDALFYTTNAGNTLFESLGLDTRALRLRRSDAMRPLGLGDDLVDPGGSPFTKLDRLYRLERPIANKFNDLRTLVDTRVRYDSLPFTFRGDWFRASADRAIVNLTLRLDPRQLSFFAIPGTETKRAEVKLFARTQTLNRVVYEFEDVLSVDVAPDEVNGLEVFLYQYTIPLKTGRYKLSLILQEEKSGKIGSAESMVLVPRAGKEEVNISSILLADHIGPAMTEEFPAPFVTAGGLKIYPNMGNVFSPKSAMGLYAEIYNLGIDQSTRRPSIDVLAEVIGPQGKVVQKENLTSIATVFYGDRVSVARFWPQPDLPAGNYTFRLSVDDRIGNQKIRQETGLTVAAAGR